MYQNNWQENAFSSTNKSIKQIKVVTVTGFTFVRLIPIVSYQLTGVILENISQKGQIIQNQGINWFFKKLETRNFFNLAFK